MNEPSVKDVLDYEALPDEVKRIAEAYFADKILEVVTQADKTIADEYDKAYDEGYRMGQEDYDCEPDTDLQDEVDELRTKVAELKDEITDLEAHIEQQDEELLALRASCGNDD